MNQDSHDGLSDAAAGRLHQKFGYNELPEEHQSSILLYLKNFWGPLPWMLELTITITFLSGRTIEGGIMAVLLLINSGINFHQRRSSEAALAALRSRLQILVRVRRNHAWSGLPARELVPGDMIRLRAGDVVPADAQLIGGYLSVDTSSLTGESLPRDVDARATVFSGSIVRHGEATGIVSAIGAETKFGQTTKLLEVSHPPTHMEQTIFSIIKYFFVTNVVLALGVAVFGLYVHAPAVEVVNFIIVLLLTSIPVAFPTMFAVAQSYGALLMSSQTGKGVLVRRLAAVQDGAIMDVLCSDKTGTLTQNNLAVAQVTHYGSYRNDKVITLAAAGSDVADEDSIDAAILRQAADLKLSVPARISLTPFDPATKHTEAEIKSGGRTVKIWKGLPEILLTGKVKFSAEAKIDLVRLSAEGLRVVAVLATNPRGVKECAGLIGLADPIRPEAPKLIKTLASMGIRVVMVTGDGRITAQAVAKQLGLEGRVITPDELRADAGIATHGSVFAETYPEDKLTIIRALQAAGHTVGMTGDGVNDAPALRQAEVGIAVAGATDVAKQSASLILTTSGLGGIQKAVRISRGVYARLRTWALNKIIKSIEVSVLTTAIFAITHAYILSPLLAVLLLLANDFVTISIATDNTESLSKPARWQVSHLMVAAAIIALVPLAGMLFTYWATRSLHFSLDATRTAMYIGLVLYGKATLLAIRAWPHAWSVAPSRTLVIALIGSFIFATIVATTHIIVPAIPAAFIVLTVCGAIISFFLADIVKASPPVKRLLGES